MSLRWRFLGAFVLLILLVVSLSLGVGYYTTQAQLDTFIGELSSDEANDLARRLSQAYTSSDGWGTLEAALSETGYLFARGAEQERAEEAEENSSEFFHIESDSDPVRVVVTDVEGYVLQDNFSELQRGEAAPDLGGQRVDIFDLRTRQSVGYAYVDVNREFWATESHGFLRNLLYTTAIGGLLTVALALLLAFWLSRRITAPVTALTQGRPVHRPTRRYRSAPGYLLRRAWADERGIQPDDNRSPNATRPAPAICSTISHMN